jgi:hypothetical protein
MRYSFTEFPERHRCDESQQESFGMGPGGLQGKRPIGLYRWDLEGLLDTLSLE